jgi:hypothetical protein
MFNHPNNQWYIFKTIKITLQWGEISRRIESTLHIPDIERFEEAIVKHINEFKKNLNAWNSVPSNPYGKTIWHSIWGYLLTSRIDNDSIRIQAFQIAMQYIDNDSMKWTDCYGNSWFHDCANTVMSLEGWQFACEISKTLWNKESIPINIFLETPFTILMKRMFEKNCPDWIHKLNYQDLLESPKSGLFI